MDNNTARFYAVDPANLTLGNAKEFKDKYNRPLEFHLGSPQNLNSYSYVTNNPLKFTDPDGEIIPFLVLAGLVTAGIFFNNIEPAHAPTMSNNTSQSVVNETKDFAELAIPAYDNLSGGQQFGVGLLLMGVTNGIEKNIAGITQREISVIVNSADDAFNMASKGVGFTKFLERNISLTGEQLEKGIRSFEKVVQEHIDKLSNPTKFMDNLSTMSNFQINGLIEKWKTDLFRNQSYMNILKDLLNKK